MAAVARSDWAGELRPGPVVGVVGPLRATGPATVVDDTLVEVGPLDVGPRVAPGTEVEGATDAPPAGTVAGAAGPAGVAGALGTAVGADAPQMAA